MKKCSSIFWIPVVTALCVLLTGGGAFADVAVNDVNFPDDAFREYVSDFDKDGDEILSTAELSAVTEIDVRECEISSLKGIEYFTGLVSLDCSKNMITELDVSKNTALLRLNCNENKNYIYYNGKQVYVGCLA